jgi:hypothetical protein
MSSDKKGGSKKRAAATTSVLSPPSASDSKRARDDDSAPPQLEGLLPDLSSYVQLWLSQDIPSFDVQGCVAGTKQVTAHLLQKSPCILAGRPFFDAVFSQLRCSVDWHAAEGSSHSSDGHRHVATVSGPAHAVLKGERTALELMVRCSGVATLASRYAQAAAATGWKGRVAGTRKVAPGLRLVDKCAPLPPAVASLRDSRLRRYGLLMGRVDTHRMDLSSMARQPHGPSARMTFNSLFAGHAERQSHRCDGQHPCCSLCRPSLVRFQREDRGRVQLCRRRARCCRRRRRRRHARQLTSENSGS